MKTLEREVNARIERKDLVRRRVGQFQDVVAW
jgi:hypothetical protein